MADNIYETVARPVVLEQNSSTRAIDPEAEIPNLQQAQIHWENALIQSNDKGHWSFLKMNLKDLGTYGIGVELYFHLLQKLSYLFLLISIISCWPLVYNSLGTQSDIQLNFISRLTVANINSTSNEDPTKHRVMVSVPDLLYSFLFLAFLMYYRCLSVNVANRHYVELPTPGDFTVQVKGFRPDQAEAVVKFFHDQNGVFHIIEHRSGDKKDESNPPIQCLLVILKSKIEKDAMLEDYKPRCCHSCKSQKRILMPDGQIPISVKQAPQPNNVIWKNVARAKWAKRLRKIAATVIAGVLMILSAVLLFIMRKYIAEIPSKESCQTSYGLVIPTPASSLKGDDTQVLCWCDGKTYEEALKISMCDYYISLLAQSYIEIAGASFLIIIINIAIEYCLSLLVRFEKSMNKARMKTRTMVELFIFMYLNTAFLILFINADFSLVQLKYGIPIEKITHNGISDFNRDWYVTVGQVYQLTMIFSMFSPHVGTVIYAKIASCCRMWKWEKTQSDLIKRFTPPDFDLSGRLAVLLTFVFSCFLLSGGIPLLNLICALGLGLISFSEKFLLLTRYKVPAEFDQMMNDRVQVLLPLCVALHCVFSMYLYGAEDIFETKGQDDTMWLNNRMSTETGVVFIVFAGVAVSMTLTSSALNRCVRKWKGSRCIGYQTACEKGMYPRCTPYDENDSEDQSQEISSMIADVSQNIS